MSFLRKARDAVVVAAITEVLLISVQTVVSRSQLVQDDLPAWLTPLERLQWPGVSLVAPLLRYGARNVGVSPYVVVATIAAIQFAIFAAIAVVGGGAVLKIRFSGRVLIVFFAPPAILLTICTVFPFRVFVEFQLAQNLFTVAFVWLVIAGMLIGMSSLRGHETT